jgi:hypothetical protein
MFRLVRLGLPALALVSACLLTAGPAAAIDYCGDGICNPNSIPPEPGYCWADCGTGTNPCPGDTCEPGSCSRPDAGVDLDSDGVSDRVEHDLAHKFFPSVLLQWHHEDRAESYLFQGRSTPYTVRPYVGSNGMCEPSWECLEIRWAVAFFYDHGDTGIDIGEHPGDSEMYAALLMINPFWTGMPDDAERWMMFRDFTAAHWGALGDSSKVAAYGLCPEPCSAYDDDPRSCNARSTCKSTGVCSGASYCPSFGNETDCENRNCTWTPSCIPEFRWGCSANWPKDAHARIFCAESKHALYHSDEECDAGGFAWTDDCPNNQFDLRDSKEHRLQNVGNWLSHAAFDTTILGVDQCGYYDVWGGTPFGEATSYLQHFTTPLNWALD